MMSENATRLEEHFAVNPVTLSDHWSRLARFLLLAGLAVVGNIGNGFMISAVVIEDYLRRRGNTFLVNVALADFLISGLVVPASAVVILAGHRNNLPVCHFQWFVAATCFLVTVLSLSAVSVENYFRLCCSGNVYNKLTRRKITVILLFFWTVCACISGLQFYTDLSFDYCTRKNTGVVPYQATIGVVFVVFPIMLAFICYVRSGFQVRQYKNRPSFKPPVTFNWDYALMLTNIYGFVLFVISWLPFGVVLAIANVKEISDKLFYNLAWLAISKSCINSILYCLTNRHFRAAYINLFNYCCCKTTVSFSRRSRGGDGPTRPSGDVRVHIIPGYNMYTSPQRATRGCDGMAGGSSHSKRCLVPSRPNGREVSMC